MKSLIKTSILKLTLSSCFAALTLGAAAQVGQSISYGTYFGGIGLETFRSLDVLPDGSTILTGNTSSFNLEMMNAFQPTYSGGPNDGFIAVFDPNGLLTYSTFLGGNASDRPSGIRSTVDGDYIVVGTTESDDYPVTPNAFQTNFGNTQTGFISMFASDHSLLWSTFFGGNDVSRILGMALDSDSNIYVYGNSSDENISTAGTHQESLGPSFSNFIAKFSPLGERLWCTYFYGNDSEFVFGIEASPDGEQLYIAGATTSTDGIALNAHQQTYNGGEQDGFLCAFNAADGTMNWGTYYGGDGYESLEGISVDNDGLVYMAGSTTSFAEIATPGTHQPELNGSWDAFVAAFNPEGERLWGTYYGGEDFDGGGPLCVSNETLTLLGGTRSYTGIATSNALYSENTADATTFPAETPRFLSRFNKNDGTVVWSTYLTPDCHRLSFFDVKTISDSKIILGGGLGFASQVPCPEIITPGAHQPWVDGGDTEAVLMFIQDNTLSVRSEDHQPLSIYPNPASREVVIDLPDAGFGHMHLQLIDLSGRVVMDEPNFATGSTLKLDGMASGIYMVKGIRDGHYFSEKLVVGM